MKNCLPVVLGVVALLCGGCDDSKNPLSDPKDPQPDARLYGVWRSDEEYYHFGRAGNGFPKGVMRVVSVQQTDDGVEAPQEFLAFCSIVGGKHCLNVIHEPKEVQLMAEKGWKPEAVSCYTFLKYEIDGDKLTMWLADEQAKQKAVGAGAGKLKGEYRNNLWFLTDTTENIARYVAAAGDDFWDAHDPCKCERVKPVKKSPRPPGEG
jgi:hypothetical protein